MTKSTKPNASIKALDLVAVSTELGAQFASRKALEAQTTSVTERINTLMADIRLYAKSTNKSIADLFGKSARTNPARAAIIDGMIAGGLKKGSAATYASAIIDCIASNRDFDFKRINGQGAPKPTQAPTVAPTIAPSGAPTSTPTPAPTIAPVGGNGAILTPNQLAAKVSESGNNGPDVQKLPNNSWHVLTLNRLNTQLSVFVQIQAELKGRGLDSHAVALGKIHKDLLEAKRALEETFKESKAI